jgi:hypothetical protein
MVKTQEKKKRMKFEKNETKEKIIAQCVANLMAQKKEKRINFRKKKIMTQKVTNNCTGKKS